jgi:Skp family chaperone for outer membrane proteins
MEFAMKKLILVVALGLGLGTASAFAYDYRHETRLAYVSPGRNGSDSRVERLNRMLSHVRWEVSRYRGDWRLRREVDRISSEVNRVNWRYQRGYDTWRLRREVDSLRAQLHDIEVRLHVRGGDYYRWD